MGVARMSRTARSLLTLNRDREYAILKRMLGLTAIDNLLDVGSGDGFWTTRFAKHCAGVIGIEPDQRMLRYARSLHTHPNLRYVRGVAEILPFPDDAFDKVVSVSCLEHFADPLRGLGEIARVLKVGGRVALSVDSLLQENSPSTFREWHRQRHAVTHYFNQEKLLAMMESVGLHCQAEQTVHLFRSHVAANVRQLFIRQPRHWLLLFPIFYGLVRLADQVTDDMHGQIIIVTAIR